MVPGITLEPFFYSNTYGTYDIVKYIRLDYEHNISFDYFSCCCFWLFNPMGTYGDHDWAGCLHAAYFYAGCDEGK